MTEKTESQFSANNLRMHKGYVRSDARMVAAASTLDELVTYGEIGSLMGITVSGSHMGRVVGMVLGMITDEERKADRPMLSAVVVSSTNRRPGPGFWGLAAQYGLIGEDADEAEKRTFWEDQLRVVRAAWADE